MTFILSSLPLAVQAGGLSEPTIEPEIVPPPPAVFVPAQSPVNGGYIILGTLLLMLIGASNIER
ncbi:hypothetical protein ACJ5NV_15650 [Loktanella agnita]|uniref:hypothetical protein n=1 Tax=Loktanella agnita TaxID=287097 RepID=UPI003989C065